ncbi:MAG: mycothione reductase [Marmoricola sp.]
MTHFDLAVIGTGSGNMILDDRFADQRAAIVEQGRFGGTCLNVGCIPTKMFVHPADLAREAGHAGRLGVDLRLDGVRWRAIRDRVFGRIDPIARDGRRYREGQDNVTVYPGHGRFIGERTLVVTVDGAEHEVSADRVVIAAGSRVTLPDIDGLADVPHHTSDTVMRLEELPRRMVIVGGGFVGAEFAHVFSSYGVQVTQLHRGPRLLGHHDEDVADRFTRLAARQWEVRLDTTVTAASRRREQTVLRLSDGTELATDVLLLATGRRPNTDLLRVERAGVEVDQDGVILVDDQQRTTADGVWALGDIASHHQLKHVANFQARVVRHNLLHPEDPISSRREAVPHAVFSSPQVAAVGLTEQEARASGTPYVSAVQEYGDVAFGWAMEDTTHFAKVLADPETRLLLGGHVIGPQASTLIQPLVQAMSLGEAVDRVARGQYWIHPALTEVVENALLHLPG